jgi:hypothetical protein
MATFPTIPFTLLCIAAPSADIWDYIEPARLAIESIAAIDPANTGVIRLDDERLQVNGFKFDPAIGITEIQWSKKRLA